MISVGLALLLLAAEPSKSIAVTQLQLVQTTPELGGYVEDRLATQLRARGFQVVTPGDMAAILGMERQKQLLGCSDDTSCYAELTDALGVSNVLLGRLTRLGTRFELDVRVIRQGSAKIIASDTRGVDDESRLGSLVERAAEALAEQLLPAAPAAPFRWRLWVPVLVGVGAIGGGTALVVTSQLEYDSFTKGGGSAVLLEGDLAISQRFQSLSLRRGLGFGVAGLGAALVVLGVVWNALVPDAPVTVSLGVSAGSSTFTVQGHF